MRYDELGMENDNNFRFHNLMKKIKTAEIFTKSDFSLFLTVMSHMMNNISLYSNDPRPYKHDYYMRIAYIVRARSNCMKRSVGAVCVGPDDRIKSVGYNGSPAGVKNCFEGGCGRCNSGSE
jgi:deoxycytidylate deaminase